MQRIKSFFSLYQKDAKNAVWMQEYNVEMQDQSVKIQ